MEGNPDSSRSCTRWLDGARKACSARSLELRYAKVKCIDGEWWKDFANGTKGYMNV